jgi:hypothetical protein
VHGQDGIGIDVGGYVIVKPVRDWHAMPALLSAKDAEIERLKECEIRLTAFATHCALYAT